MMCDVYDVLRMFLQSSWSPKCGRLRVVPAVPAPRDHHRGRRGHQRRMHCWAKAVSPVSPVSPKCLRRCSGAEKMSQVDSS